MPAGIEQQQNRTSPTIYAPLQLRKQDKDPENFSNYSVIARLRPGINVRAADTEVATIQKRLSSKYTEANVAIGIHTPRSAHTPTRWWIRI